MDISRCKLPISFDAARLAADVELFGVGEWQPHFNIHNYQGEWSVVPLRAVKDGHLSIYPDPEARSGYVETEQMERCRYVPEILTLFECDLQTVRLMKLAAGALIRRHRDYALGLEDGFVRIHIPATTNPQVEFILDDTPVAMSPGEAWYLNVNYHHSVTNGGRSDRVHLVVDCVVNDWLRDMIELSA